MNTQDYLIISSMVLGIVAGILAVLSVLALRGRVELWKNHMNYVWSPGFLIMAASHWLGWYGLLITFPAYALVFLAFWFDSRKKF